MTEPAKSNGRQPVRLLVRSLVLCGGLALIAAAVLAPIALTTKVVLILVGMLVYEAGIWRIADWFLPETRKYLALRKETDYFLSLVRDLNREAVHAREGIDTAAEVERIRDSMVGSVERMVHYAGKTPRELQPTTTFDLDLPLPDMLEPVRSRDV